MFQKRVILSIPHPRFSSISVEVFEIDTKRGPLKKVEFKASYLHNGVLGSSPSLALSEVDAGIELLRAIKEHYLPYSSKRKPADSFGAPPAQRPERTVYHDQHPPQQSTVSAQQYGDQQYEEQLSSSSTDFSSTDDIPF